MTTLRVVTWNIAAGQDPGPRPGVPALDEIAGTLQGLRADLVALQEVDRGIARSGRTDQPGRLAGALGMRAWFAPTLTSDGGDGPWRPLDAPGRDPGGPGYGIALLTRLAVERVEPVVLPSGPRPAPAQEPRVALVATVEVGGRPLTVAATHLDRRPRHAALQLRRLQNDLGGRPGPRLLLGDLNLRPAWLAVAGRPGWRRAVSGPTHPARRPVRQLDHVLLAGAGLRVRGARVVAAGVSDHRAVVADLDVGAAGTDPAGAE